MKKILWGIAICAVALQACKKDNDDDTTEVQVSVEEQNEYDNKAAIDFLENHYFDESGLIVAFDKDDTSDDNEKKLSAYNPVKLPSGVIYIVRPDAQPVNGKSIGESDVISIMQDSKFYIAKKLESGIKFTNEATFSNTISGGYGIPVEDPSYYYVTPKFLADFNEKNKTTFDKYYFEVKGLREGLQYFKAFDLENSANYNLQGVIIVPSRQAFARNVNYYSIPNDRSIVFNFQIYRTKKRD